MASKTSPKLLNGNTQSKESAKKATQTNPKTAVKDTHEAIAVLMELDAVMKKVSNHSSTYADFGKILDQKSALELQINDKTTELMMKDTKIAFLKANSEENLEIHEKRYAEWANEMGTLEQQVVEAKANAAEKHKLALADLEAKHKKEITRLKKDLATEKTKSDSIAQKLETSIDTETELQHQLSIAKTSVKKWEGKLSMLKDIDLGSFTEKFQKLAQQYMTVMRTNFRKNLPDRLLDRHRWDNLPKDWGIPLSFPASNSPAAKNARLIAALWTLSPLLSDCIFTPYRVNASGSDNKTIKMLLRRQLCVDNQRENMVRSLILTSSPREEIARAGRRAADFTGKEGQRLLGHMLEDPEKFRNDLQPVLQDLANLWDEAIWSRKFILASIEGDSVWEWGDMPEFDDEYPVADMLFPTAELPKFNTLNLFPRVFVPETEEVIDSGILVWAEQNSVRASEAEYRKELHDRRNSVNGNGGGPVGPPPRRARRQSTVDGGGSSRTGSAPSSPAIGKMPGNGGSFLGEPQKANGITNGSHGNGESPGT
ncbi:MAG: hypothetical protein M1839_004128 [Geoglossum umbratile]|nr:MAG: hypothetical protein M1839_004128 [Geoglossum umbratile]